MWYNMKSRILNLFTLLFIVGGLTISCSSGDDAVETEPANEISLETEAVRKVSSTSLVTFSGEISSASRVKIATKVMGTIESIPFKIGESFNKGDLILKIDDTQVMAQKSKAEAALQDAKVGQSQAQRDYDRYKALYENESASLREWENAQNHLQSMNSRLSQAEAAIAEVNDLLSFTKVRAAFPGVIAAKYMEEGDLTAPGQTILDIERNQNFQIDFSIPESSVNSISLNDTIGVRVPVLGNDVFMASISNLNRSGNQRNRQFEVEAKLITDIEELRSGLYADVLIEQNSGDEGLFISRNALIERGQLKGVYVVNSDNKILLRWIRTGKNVGDDIEVLSGLSEGEMIVSKPTPTLKDGLIIANL